MFAHSHEWNVPNILNQSKVTEDIFVICDAFECFERHSLIRLSPNTSRDFTSLRRRADRNLHLGEDPSGEEIHLFLSRLWRMAFEASRDWLRLFNKLGLQTSFQKPMAVLTLSAIAPLKHYRNVIASLPNLLFTLRLMEEISNSFYEHTQLSWMNWQSGQAGAIITALCDPLQVQVVERWIHTHLSPLLPVSQHIFDEHHFWSTLESESNKLFAQQLTWQQLFPETEISIDVYHS
ncbi:MAG: hypothetical protein VX185_06115 [Pseudomonadota bacterium]|nr:hypothetical protein [Gammaproteobacteria bacterium]MEC8010332.1 hypothetical protein [Pseudomonadota bacterium]HBF09063.1 hypothetical protein [Gammaproteobacteria bacterium]|tara:strand:- start:30111 stop:30815 length:705 start_codon:yes stop_codon:yes gene_type:complete